MSALVSLAFCPYDVALSGVYFLQLHNLKCVFFFFFNCTAYLNSVLFPHSRRADIQGMGILCLCPTPDSHPGTIRTVLLLCCVGTGIGTNAPQPGVSSLGSEAELGSCPASLVWHGRNEAGCSSAQLPAASRGWFQFGTSPGMGAAVWGQGEPIETSFRHF